MCLVLNKYFWLNTEVPIKYSERKGLEKQSLAAWDIFSLITVLSAYSPVLDKRRKMDGSCALISHIYLISNKCFISFHKLLVAMIIERWRINFSQMRISDNKYVEVLTSLDLQLFKAVSGKPVPSLGKLHHRAPHPKARFISSASPTHLTPVTILWLHCPGTTSAVSTRACTALYNTK